MAGEKRAVEKASRFRRIFPRLKWYLWLGLWAGVILLYVFPVGFRTLRLAMLLGIAGLWGGGIFLFWKHEVVRYLCLAAPLPIIVFLHLPGRAAKPEELRRAYVAALKKYEGTPYVWGGENRLGIDCSGLVRNGLIDANLRLSLIRANPRLLRTAISLWWHDCSAKALRDQYRQLTRFMFAAPSINQLDHARILPGDLAVTADGVHVLAYLGDRLWIEADPYPLKVITVKVPVPGNVWFSKPVHLMRWTQLERKNAEPK